MTAKTDRRQPFQCPVCLTEQLLFVGSHLVTCHTCKMRTGRDIVMKGPQPRTWAAQATDDAITGRWAPWYMRHQA